MAKYLAVDIGASSGRIFEAALTGGKIELRELFRFDDYLRYEENTYFWDIDNGRFIYVPSATDSSTPQQKQEAQQTQKKKFKDRKEVF